MSNVFQETISELNNDLELRRIFRWASKELVWTLRRISNLSVMGIMFPFDFLIHFESICFSHHCDSCSWWWCGNLKESICSDVCDEEENAEELLIVSTPGFSSDPWNQQRSIAGFRTSCETLLTKEHSTCVKRQDTLSVLLPMGDRRGLMSFAGPLEGTIRSMRSRTWISLCGHSLWKTHQGSPSISPERTSDPL